MGKYFIYILTNKFKKVLYTGMTNNLYQRILEHKMKVNEGFTQRYNVDKLVYFEIYETHDEAVNREKQIKAGSGKKKLELINNFNSDWHDLFEEICSNNERE